MGVFAAAIQNGRAITISEPEHLRLYRCQILTASMREFEQSKFQPRTCSGCKKKNDLGEDSERGHTIVPITSLISPARW